VILHPRPTVTTESLLAALNESVASLSRQQDGHIPFDRLNSYLTWAHDEVRRFGLMVWSEDIDRLILTRRYWSLQGLDPASHGPTLNDLLNLEWDERKRDLEATRDSLRQEIRCWQSRSGALVLPDTNVYLQHRETFDSVDWTAIMDKRDEEIYLLIPLVVVDELDDNKRSNKLDLRGRARDTLRRFERLSIQSGAGVVIPSTQLSHPTVRAEILMEDAQHRRLPRADDELVDVAIATQILSGRRVLLVTFDKGMAVRGRSVGLEVRLLDQADEREDGKRRQRQHSQPAVPHNG
jgi:rRNA-processing protein FCF1